MVRLFPLALLPILLVATSCDNSKARPPVAQVEKQQTYQVQGMVLEVKPREKTVRIRHQEVPGYMPAMTMPFEVKDTKELAGLQPGDSVSFRMIVTEKDGWIDQIQKSKAPATNGPPPKLEVRVMRDVEPLKTGDLLPDYHFTNQFGQPVSTAQFKGQVLAINFLFTRCPFPAFCPFTANNFAEVQTKLLALPNPSTNWHLLTISFDPDFDKPDVLKAYAERYKYDPAHWIFATGDIIDVTAIGEQFGLMFWRDETGLLSHNLRAAVVDPSGRVQKIFEGNKWTGDDLVAEMVKANSDAAKR
jgi:protein SCO1/2